MNIFQTAGLRAGKDDMKMIENEDDNVKVKFMAARQHYCRGKACLGHHPFTKPPLFLFIWYWIVVANGIICFRKHHELSTRQV